MTEEELVACVPEVSGLIVGLDPITDRVLRKAGRLQAIAKYGTGTDNIDLRSATRRGIIVASTPGANSAAVAELAIGLMLAVARDRGISSYRVLCDEAHAIPAGTDGLVFLPFLAGERSPYWNANIRGTLLGLSLQHGQAHMIRALMEDICYGIWSVAQPLEVLTGTSRGIRMSGGFTQSTIWMQILANVMGRELVVLSKPEASVLGAAVLAGHALGLIDSFQCLQKKTLWSRLSIRKKNCTNSTPNSSSATSTSTGSYRMNFRPAFPGR